MTNQCQHLNANGQQCRGLAIWGSDPPRCAIHRQDGGPPPRLFQKGNQYGHLSMTHGFYSRRPFGPPQTIEQEAALLLHKHERLAGFLALQSDPAGLLHLCRLYTWNLDRLVDLLDRYHQTTGQHPDHLLRVANGQPKADLRAGLETLRANLRAGAGSTYAGTPNRSPRYWLIYDFIAGYIERYWVGPTRRQIKQACHITSNDVINYWLDKLEQDGRIIRRRGQKRGIDLPGEPMDDE
jgi:hypothetical protein